VVAHREAADLSLSESRASGSILTRIHADFTQPSSRVGEPAIRGRGNRC
jgi:hypothetical protein